MPKPPKAAVKKPAPKPKQQLPEYQRPFAQKDFRGYFRWTDSLSRRLGGSLYHACHEDELDEILDAGELPLRSKWELRLPEHGLWSVPGVWCGLNDFGVKGNYYGPCLIRFPVSVLRGRNFMVFQRQDEERGRYFFVQHESGIPIYSFNDQSWRTVNAEYYFAKAKGKLYRKDKAIYDIVLTQPLPLTDYTVRGMDHPHCISRKCGCCNSGESDKIIRRVGLARAQQILNSCEPLQALLTHLPCLDGQKITLEQPDED